MQTFLTSPSFAESARVLDNKRLGKQRVEGLQILQIIGRKQGWLENPNNFKGFRNHPAVKMWESDPLELVIYVQCICDEWTNRGYKDSVRNKITALVDFIPLTKAKRIDWLHNDEINKITHSHQSNLIRKDASFYSPQFPNVPPNIPYYWPVK
jgi:hypothetical protein